MTKQAMVWIDALLDGAISPEDFQKLEEILKSNPATLQHYCKQAEIHGRLEWELACPESKRTPIHSLGILSRKTTPIHRQPSLWLSAAALILAVLGLAILNREPEGDINFGMTSPSGLSATSDDLASEETESIPIARLTKTLNATWSHFSPIDGAWLDPGELQLLSGSAEITFDSGARIILQGPANLSLINSYHANLTRGKATTHVPEATEGFVLDTPSSSFSRNNTSFAVAVEVDGSTEVHAINGLVEATPRANPILARVLSGSESIRLTDTLVLAEHNDRHAIGSFDLELPWPIAAAPSHFLHWSLDGDVSSELPETGRHGGPPFPARMYARPGSSDRAHSEFIDGRHGKAIDFNGYGAFLSSGFPGIGGSAARTVAFWVRIPPDSERKQAYSMVAWGPPHSLSGEKWQISWNPGLDNSSPIGAIRTEFGGGFVIGSTDLRDGNWHHIACVFLGGESVNVATHIRHYVDGQLEPVTGSAPKMINTQLTIPSSLPTYFGRRLEFDNPSYGFKGALDEIYIFPAALTPGQIGQLFRENSPPDRLVPGY